MTYEPLHHKYRPQTFADLVGQDAIATTLTNALCSGRIAPAYLFTGPRGTGKTSSARILAKSLNCLSSDQPTATPCGLCEICQGISNGSTLDFIEIDAASNTGVDHIRELIERAQFSPVQCRYKVYVIDECHMLSVAAFNALLKTLEEPPKRVVFVLATTDPQRVLATIISRCQRFDFCRIPLEPMVQHLQEIAQLEKISITTDAVKMVAQMAQGGLRDAESLLDQLSLLSGEITVERVWDLVGAVPERDLMTLLTAIASEDATAIIDCTRNLLNRGREPIIVLQNLAEFYRDLLIAKTTPERSDLVKLTQPTWEQLCQFAQEWNISRILAGQKHLRQSETQIKNTTQPRLWLEVTLLELLSSALPQTVAPVESTVRMPSTTPPQISPAVNVPPPPAPPTPPETVPPPSAPPQPTPPPPPTPSETLPPTQEKVVTPAPTPANDSEYDLDEIWQLLLAQVQPMATQALLRQHGRLLTLNTESACVGIRSQKLLKIAQDKVPNIEAAFEKVFHHRVKVRLEVGFESPQNFSNSPTPSPINIEPKPTNKVEAPPQTSTSPQVEESPKLSSENLSKIPSVEQPNPSDNTPPPQTSESEILRQADAKAVQLASQKLVEFFKGEIINLPEEEDSTRVRNFPSEATPDISSTDFEFNETEDQDDVPF